MSYTAGGCRAAIGGLTLAMRAQKALAAAAIPTAVIKYDSDARSNKGCTYGLAFSCAQRINVETVLVGEGIKVREWKAES